MDERGEPDRRRPSGRRYARHGVLLAAPPLPVELRKNLNALGLDGRGDGISLAKLSFAKKEKKRKNGHGNTAIVPP